MFLTECLTFADEDWQAKREGKIMKSIKNVAKRLWNDESGQGMAEYVLLIVVVVTVAFVFRDKIKGMVTTKMDQVGGEFQGFQVERQ